MANRLERAQCLVIRNNKILMVKHCHEGEEWWCLPGGAIEKGETPKNLLSANSRKNVVSKVR